MKAYGVKPRDRGCCPGHDKYPADSSRNRRSKRARAKSRRLSHKAARARERAMVFAATA
jgi:hypothetical protein